MTLLVFAVVAYLAVTLKAQDCPQLVKAGNCVFYNVCVDRRFQCGTNGYPRAYGERYCNSFTNQQRFFTTAVSF